MANDVAHRLFGKLDLLRRDSVFVDLTRNQVLERDVDFFFLCVALEFDDLHAIAQRFGNGIKHVRGRNEEDFRQIEGHVQVVVAEAGILLGIERLEQRRSRVAAEVPSHLVDFVEHEDGIFRFGAPNALNDLAGQCSDVGAAMAADFSLIMHSA